MAVSVSAKHGHHSPKWYLALAGLAGGVHLIILVSLAGLEIAAHEHAGAGRYGGALLHGLGRVLSSPVFLFFHPGWTSWLRPYASDDRWMIGSLVVLNSLAWGAALAGSTWWW